MNVKYCNWRFRFHIECFLSTWKQCLCIQLRRYNISVKYFFISLIPREVVPAHYGAGKMFCGSKYENSFVNTIKLCHDRPLPDIETSAQTLSSRAWGFVGHSVHNRQLFLLLVDYSSLSENSLSRKRVHQDCSVCLLTVLAKCYYSSFNIDQINSILSGIRQIYRKTFYETFVHVVFISQHISYNLLKLKTNTEIRSHLSALRNNNASLHCVYLVYNLVYMAGSCENCNEHSTYIKCRKFLE